ncbi:MAG TPA: radical SAM protein [Bryobacteraceae bacterium]|nr:radical SAM protein [Bryobacteraceae bacterium]
MKVALVNLNLIKVPAIAPYGLDIIGSGLEAAGHEIDVVDLCREDDPILALHSYFSSNRPDLVGLTMRNAVDLYFPSYFDLAEKGSFLKSHKALIDIIKGYAGIERILIGGVGFSVNPHAFLGRLGLRYGVKGPGELVISQLANALGGKSLRELAGGAETFVFDGRKNRIQAPVKRKFVDNRWYYEFGGQAAIRTSSGCAMRCNYCAEPAAAGNSYRRVAVENTLREIDELVALGIRDFQTADSEFNMPLAHAKDVLRGIISRGYGSDVRFWAYCQPRPFDAEYASLLAKAGFIGVNFGTDHVDPQALASLGKWYRLSDVERSTRLCKDNGMVVMHELLFGTPGDEPEKMRRAIDSILALDPWVLGVSIGLTVLPDTPLGAFFLERRREGRIDSGFYFAGEPMVDPTFYVDPSFEIPDVFQELERSVGRNSSNVMLPAVSSTSSINNQLVNSDRVRRQLLVEKRKGPSWYHFPPGVGRIPVHGGSTALPLVAAQ